MLCSIVIPAFNARAVLVRAVRSALAQEAADIEVIVVDDCSRDDTLAVAKASIVEDARVRVLRTDRNAGPGIARNLGYAAARGEWIAVLDADDAYNPRRIRSLVALGASSGADFVADNLLIQSEDQGLNGQLVFNTSRLPSGLLTGEQFIRGNITAASDAEPSYGLLKPVIRRTFLQRHGITYPPLRFAEDFIFLARCFAAGGTMQVLQDAYYHYAVHSDSLTFSSRLQDIASLLTEERKLIKSSPLDSRSPMAIALRNHVESVQRGYDWRHFAESLKAKHFIEAALVAGLRPSVLRRAIAMVLGDPGARAGTPRAAT